eukprot:4367483-Prymnesium_polylepis.1
MAANVSDGAVRAKKGYARPSLSAGLVDDAGPDAPEHAAPMIAWAPTPPNASRVKWSAPDRLVAASHLESR